MKVFNIARYIPVTGLPLENDVSLKIYYDLRIRYGIKSLFVKPVTIVSFPFYYFGKNLQERRKIYLNNSYQNADYGINIKFYNKSSILLAKIPMPRRWNSYIEWKIYGNGLIEYFDDYNPDIIHAHDIHPDGFYALKLSKEKKVPFVITLREKNIDLYKKQQIREILDHASAVTTPSFYLYSKLKSRWDIQLIPHGIGEVWFNARDDSGVTKSEINLITVSRLLEMKNIQVVIDVVGRLIKQGFNVNYDIVGDGEFCNELKKMVNHKGLNHSIQFHGYLQKEDIIPLHLKADFHVMLSHPETFGRSFFEAAANGVIPIGVKENGAHGHLKDKHGYFINVKDDMGDELFKILSTVERDEIERKRSELYSEIVKYRNDSITERYYDILSQIT